MRSFLYALFLAILFTGPALADRVAFPPDNCNTGNPFMAFDGVATGGNTYCINGQSVLSNALPGCSPNQQVIFNGTSFICQDSSSDLNLPSCGAGQFLTSDGTNFSCTSTSVPTCQANYVLTYNGSAFTCVPKTASVPTCAANQFLTYNGTSFQCAATQQLTLPACGADQVLTSSGTSLSCVAQSGGGSVCGTGTPLYNGTHKTGDCECAGGLVRATEDLCQFAGTFCPTGWTRRLNWGGTQAGLCANVYGACTTSAHAWANMPNETCMWWPDPMTSAVCTAPTTSVGCY